MGKLKKLFVWLKSSFEDDDGHASHRKMTIFAFTILVWLMVILTYKSGNPQLFSETVWLSVIGGALGMSYIRRLQVKDHEELNK